MVRPIYVPQAGRFVNFSDTASDDDIKSYIRTNFPKPQPVEAAAADAAPAEPKYSDAGLGALLSAGFAESYTDIPGGISSIMTPEETAATRASDEAKKAIREKLGIKEGEEWSIPQYGAYIAGQLGGLLVPGTGEAAILGRVLQGTGKAAQIARGLLTAEEAASGVQKLNLAGKLAKPVTLTQAGALQAEQAKEKIEQQRAEGMEITPEQQLATTRLNFGVGLMDLLPLERFAGPLAGILTKVPAQYAPIAEKIISNRLSRIVGSAAAEGSQEVIQGITSDLIEKGIYNPDAAIGQDIFTNAAGGAFGGTLLEGIVQIASGRKMRGLRQLQADLKTEQGQALADLNQASIAQAAEQLRATGIEGELDIQPNEDMDGNIRYTITSPTGAPLVDTISENEAAAAIDMYRAKTGAKVSLKPTQAPKLNMIQIGGERFPGIEAANKRREDLRKYVKSLDSYYSNIAQVSKEAAQKGVAPGVYAKQIDDTLRSARSKLAQFDAYFGAVGPEPIQPTVPKATAPAPAEAPATAPAEGPVVASETPPATPVAAPEEAAVALPVEPPVEPVAAAEITEPTPFEAPEAVSEAVAPEPITEDQVPEMPIGAVELPVEESRVLPDTIVDAEAMPQEVDIDPAATQTVKRPSATDEQLTALKVELFGKPIGYREMTPEQLSQYEAERDRRYPPVDTEVYLSAGQTGATKPRSLRDAAINNPVERAYTPETQEWMKKVYAGVQARLDAIVPEAAKAELRTLIPSPAGTLARGQESGVETQFGIKSLVDISMGILKPGMSVDAAVKQLVDIVNHEIIHVLTRKGVLRPNEWKMLSRAAANTKVPGKKYTYLDKAEAVYTPNGMPISPEYANAEAVVEEAVAEMYRDWVKNGKGQQAVNGLFNRITEFFRRIFQALRGAGYDDVFKRIESGEIGKREGEMKAGAARFSVAPTGVMAGSQDPEDKEFLTVAPFPDDNIGSSTVYLRRDYERFKGPGRRKDESWGAALDRAFIDKFGRVLDINNPADYEQIVASVSDEVKHQMKQAQSGVGWYDDDIKKVFEKLANTFPILRDPIDGPVYRQMFTMIAGVMSNGMKAKANVELAAINFAHFLNTGKFSPIHPFTGMGWNQRSNIMGPQIDMLNRMIEDKAFAPRPGSNNPRLDRLEKFLEFMFSTHPVREINQFRAKHGTKSPAKIGRLDDVRLGMYAFGPKFGPFILNLNGLSDETVDSWASRSFYRNMGRSVGPDGQLVKGPLTNNDRESMKRALRDVGAQTNLSSRDIQAVLWFYEKELYNHLGQKIPLEVFSDGAGEFDRKYGAGAQGPLQSRSDRERRIIGAVKAAGTQTSQTAPRGARFSAAPVVDSEEFKRWFKSSKAVNPDGTPQRWFHGTPASFKQFGMGRSGAIQGEEGPFFFSRSPEFTEDYSIRRNYAGGDRGDVEVGGRTIPVYLSVQNPFDYENPQHVASVVSKLREMHENNRYPIVDKGSKGASETLENRLETIGYDLEDGDWPTIEKENVQRAIRELGYDSFFVKENNERNLAVYRPEQVKSIFNKFEEGAATSKRFSAAPLPDYIAQQNETLYAQEPKTSLSDGLFGYFFGHRPTGKVLNTVNYGNIELSRGKMAAVAGRAAVVDAGAYVRELESLLNEKQTGNFQRMEADTSATAALAWRRRSGHLTASMMLRGKLTLNFQTPGDIMSATMKVEDDPDSLKEIFKVLNEEGPTNPRTGERETKAKVFRDYAVAKRAEWLRSTGQNVPRELTPQYIREVNDFTTREYPEVIEAYNKYQRFNKNLLTTAKEAGLISQAELGRLTNQMNYYGFNYEVYGDVLGPTSAQKTASRFKLRPYTGSGRGGLANDPMFVMIQNAQFWVDSIAKNLAAYKSFEVARQMGEARILGTGEAPDEAQGEAPDVMFFSLNGEVKRFSVKDPLLVIALGSDDRVTVGKFWDALGVPAHILRESVTRDPGFMARNLLRDTVSSWITSGVDFMPVIDTIRGGVDALKKGDSFGNLSARGVVGSYDLAMMGPKEIADTFRRNAMPMNVKMATSVEGLNAATRSLWNRLGAISEASDAATRIAVYNALIAQGKSEAEAAMQAIELLDFTRRGASQTLSILTKLIPFLNARIQGMDVLYQAGRSGIRYATGQSLGERDANVGKKFLVRGAMLAAIAVALEMMNQDDEDYKQLDDYIKTGNFIVPLKHFGLPGQFIAIPKPFEAGLLFATIPQQIYKTTTGQASTRENAQLFWGQLASTFGVNPIPQALLPPIEIITNHNFYTGLPLISEGKSRLAPELQYNTSTSQLAMMIGGLPIFYDFTTGKFGGASPIVIDKLISGYGGPIGTYMVEAVSLGMETANVGPDRMPRDLTKLPVVKSFFIDAKSKNPKVVTQAYELFQIADEANRTVSRLKQMRDVEALTQYVSENKDILRYKPYIFKLADNLNKLSAQERAIERDSKMTPDEKLAAQRKLRETRIRLASKVNEINKILGR